MSHSLPTWLITGTSAGLGLALSLHIMTAGHNLVSISRHSTATDTLVDLAKARGSILHHLRIDLSVSDESNIKSHLEAFFSTHPDVKIDILVNNAAITAFAPLETIRTSTVCKVMTVNFWSPLWLIQACLPSMRLNTSRHGKVIVNISSTQGCTTDPSEVAYDASKYALEGMSGVLAKEVASFGIRVVVANLGSFRTSFALGDSSNAGAADTQGQTVILPDDPYQDPSHPVKKRIEMVLKFANTPGAARGDIAKGAKVLYDAVMKTEGTRVNEALSQQRQKITNGDVGNVSSVERIVLGSDAQPKLETQAEWFRMQVESCKIASNEADAEVIKSPGAQRAHIHNSSNI